DHGARTNDGVAKPASVYRRVGTDFDIVSDHDATKLRYADRSARSWSKSETGCANPCASKDFHPIAYQRVADRSAITHNTTIAEYDALPDHSIAADPAA